MTPEAIDSTFAMRDLNPRTLNFCVLEAGAVIARFHRDSDRDAFLNAQAAIRAAVAEEREAAARMVEGIHADPENSHDSWEWCSCEQAAAAIRARGVQ